MVRYFESELEHKVAEDLKRKGIAVVRKATTIGRKSVDMIGYTINNEGKLEPQVIVEVKRFLSMDAQRQLMDYAEVCASPFALLATPEKYIWFETKTFLQIDEPQFTNERMFIANEEEIEKLFSLLFDLLKRDFSISEEVEILLHSLLIRAYLHEQNAIDKWFEIGADEEYHKLLVKAFEHFGIYAGYERKQISENIVQSIVWNLDVLPPIHPIYSSILLNVLERKREIGLYVTPPSVRNLFAGLVKSLNLTNVRALDMTAGYGAITFEIMRDCSIASLTAYEIDRRASNYLKIISVVSGYSNLTVHSEDVLQANEKLRSNSYGLVLVDPPLLKIQGDIDDYKMFHVTQEGTRKRVDASELFIEKAINSVAAGGYVVALVPEGVLFSKPSQITRELIKEKMIIEAIISLPPHSLKPYTAVKVSLLVMRKKVEENERAKELFLAKPDSIEQFEEVVEGFKTWRTGGKI
jgi:tRNA1(Val) A37 N6-methylase TrmN6/Holliday junction resolvase